MTFIADLQQQGKIDPSIPLPKTKIGAADLLTDLTGKSLPPAARRGRGRKKKLVQAKRTSTALGYFDMYKDSKTATGLSQGGFP